MWRYALVLFILVIGCSNVEADRSPVTPESVVIANLVSTSAPVPTPTITPTPKPLRPCLTMLAELYRDLADEVLSPTGKQFRIVLGDVGTPANLGNQIQTVWDEVVKQAIEEERISSRAAYSTSADNIRSILTEMPQTLSEFRQWRSNESKNRVITGSSRYNPIAEIDRGLSYIETIERYGERYQGTCQTL